MSTSPTNANFYADFKSLSALKLDAKTDEQKALRGAAEQFESLFTAMMLKSMRAATSQMGGMDNSNEMDLYQSMFDQQISTQMSKGKGLGLADMLVQQLTRSGLVKGSDEAEGRGLKAEGQSDASNAVAPTVGRTSVRQSGQDVGLKSDLQSDLQPSASNQKPNSPADFVASVWPQAKAAAEQLGVDPATLVAHAALETGWGKHVPCNADGSSSFNLFGIKASSNWNGDSVGAHTVEFEQGVAVKRVQRFKSYDSAAECFADYASMLSNSSRFSGASNTGSNTSQFAHALQKGGYATDPHYATKLKAVAHSVMSLVSRAAQATTQQADTNA